MKSKKNILATGNISYNIILLLGLVHFGFAFFPTAPVLLFVWMLVVILSIVNPVYGLAGWIMLLPFEEHLVKALGFSPFLGHTSSLLFGTFFNFLLGKSLKIKKFSKLFFYFIMITSLVSVLISQTSGSIRHIISIMLLVFVFIIIASLIEKQKMSLIIHSLVVAAILGFLYSVINMDGSWRLAQNGNVRNIANALGLGIVLLFANAFMKKKNSNTKEMFPYGNKVALILCFILVLGLILTISRGVILAVIVSIFSMLLFGVVFNKNQNLSYKKVFLIIPVVSIVIYYSINYFDSNLTRGHITKRINSEAVDNVRLDLWSSVLEQLNVKEWMLGTGLGTFNDLSQNAGYYFYAHSVYIDILVTMGIIGLSLFFFSKIYFLKNLVKKQSALGISLLIFILLSFSTHGNVTSKYYWLTFGIISGLSYINDSPKKVDALRN